MRCKTFQFCGADEGKITRVEEEDNPLAFIVGQAEFVEFSFVVRLEMREGRGGESNADHSVLNRETCNANRVR